jgi:putative membrane protein
MLAVGIVYHMQFMIALRKTREEMAADGLVHGKSPFPPSFTLLTALILLAIGVAAIVSMSFRIGPLG